MKKFISKKITLRIQYLKSKRPKSMRYRILKLKKNLRDYPINAKSLKSKIPNFNHLR